MRSLFVVQIVAALCIGLGGCASRNARLVDEGECSDCRDLHIKWSSVERREVCVPTVDAIGREAPIAVHIGGNKTASHALVFVHGVFSDHTSWRFVAADLADDYRLLLVDLLGCGASAAELDDAWYGNSEVFGLDALADRTLQAVGEILKSEPSVREVTIVAHSLGGAIALRMFASDNVRQRHAELLAKVDGLFLIAPLDIGIEKVDPTLAKVATLSGLEVWLGDLTGRMQSVVEQTVGEGVGPDRMALREEADKRIEILRDGRKRRATQAMIRCAVPSLEEDRFRPDWSWVQARTDETRRVEEPALIVWGACDETLPASMGYKLYGLLPYSELRVFEDVKHSPQLERPRDVASMIREFREGSTIARSPHGPVGEWLGSPNRQ